MRLFIALLVVSGRNLLRQKLRSLLTLLGVIIAVAAVMVTNAIGEGAQLQATAAIRRLGTDFIFVYPIRSLRSALSGGALSLTEEDANAVARLSEVKSVTPYFDGRTTVKYGDRSLELDIAGTGHGFEKNPVRLTQGTFFSGDLLGMEVVFGAGAAHKLFGNETDSEIKPLEKVVVGERVRIGRLPFVIKGVLGVTGTKGYDDTVFIPLYTAQRRIFGARHITGMTVIATSTAAVVRIKAAVDKLLARRHQITEGAKRDFAFYTAVEQLETQESVSDTFRMLLLSIAAVSLIIGGIGIMNTMMVSVTERTREIGVRKAIGARNRDILMQFLVESTMLTGIGGLIGLAFGFVSSFAVGKVTQWTTSINMTTAWVALFVAVSTGVFFGLYPAYRASQLSPIEALRYE